jgi:hypothetical protein
MIGHSGGYDDALLRGLGVEDVTILERCQDLVIVVREPDGTVRTSVLGYGGPSSLDPARRRALAASGASCDVDARRGVNSRRVARRRSRSDCRR